MVLLLFGPQTGLPPPPPATDIAQASLGLAKQSAKGVPASVATERVPLAGGLSPAPAKVALLSDAVSASQRFRLSSYVPDLRVLGDPEVILRPNVIGLLLYAALGTKAVSGSSDPWTHTFTAGTTQPWLTIWRTIGGVIYERFSDVKVSSLRISSQSGRPVRVSVGLIGIQANYQTAPLASPDLEVLHPMLHWHGKGAYLVDGAAVSSLSDWDVTIETGAEPRDTLAAYDVRTGSRMRVIVRTSQLITNDDLWARHIYGSANPSNGATATRTPLELGSSGLSFKLTEQASPERSLRLDIPRVVLTGLPSPVVSTTGAPPRLQATYEALKPASGSAITATLKNERSGY